MAFNIFATATSDIPLANLDANFTMIGSSAVASTLYPTATTSITYGTTGTTHYFSGSGLAVTGTLSTTDAVTITKNGNADTTFRMTNSTSGTSAGTSLFIGDGISNVSGLLHYNTSHSAYGNLVAGDSALYSTWQTMRFANDIASPIWKWTGASGLTTDYMSLTSTGLAVTGTLSTTGEFTTTGGSNVQTSWTLQESGTRSLVLKNPTNVLAASVGTGTNHDLQVEGSQVYIQVGSFGSRSTAATFDSSGNLLVGNTATIGSSKILSNFSATTSVGIVCNETNNTANTKFIGFHNQSTDIGSITRVGSTSAVIYNTTSDYRLKTIVGAVTGQGERIDALKPIDYLWTEGGQQARGFLAHEFQEVYASSVTGTKDSVDEDGNPIYQGMQAGTAEVIADLVAELQSLRKRITALEAK